MPFSAAPSECGGCAAHAPEPRSGLPLFHALLLAALAACLLAAAQDFRWAAPLVLVALLPLLPALAAGAFRALWLRLSLFYSIYLLLTLFWLRLTGPGTAWLIPLAIAFSWIFAALPAAALAFFHTALRRWLVLAPAWMLMEMLERHVLFRINWIVLGQPLVAWPPAAQIAALAGPETTTFLAILLNAGLAGALLLRGRRILGAVIFTAACCLALCFGWLQYATAPAPSTVLRAGVVQPMNSQRLVWTAANRVPLLAKMDALIDSAARRHPDLIILPEWAVVGALRYDSGLARFATGAVRRTAIPVLLGAGDFDSGRYYNAATLIAPDGRLFTYRKMRLIPFVEYTPRALPYAPPGWVRFSPGSDAAVFHLLPGVDLAVLICLEDTLPGLARQFAARGASLLVALVNTENYAGTPEALQHLRRAQLTAIAAGLPMLRAANSALSCVLDSRGRILDSLPPNRPAADTLAVPVAGRATLYRWIGDWTVMVLLAALIALCIAASRSHV